MLLREFTKIPEPDTDLDEKQIWARSGNKVVRKYRCAGGKRHGRIVSKIAQCFAAPDMKKRMQMKKTRAKLGARMMRKARKTKRTNRASKAVQRLNRMSRKR
jgi:ribosomal protein L31E